MSIDDCNVVFLRYNDKKLKNTSERILIKKKKRRLNNFVRSDFSTVRILTNKIIFCVLSLSTK